MGWVTLAVMGCVPLAVIGFVTPAVMGCVTFAVISGVALAVILSAAKNLYMAINIDYAYILTNWNHNVIHIGVTNQ